MTKNLEILVVSDATGATAEAVVTSTLVQFGCANVRLQRRPFTRTLDVTNRSIEETSDWITHNVL